MKHSSVDEENRLWESGALIDVNTPAGLQNVAFLDVGKMLRIGWTIAEISEIVSVAATLQGLPNLLYMALEALIFYGMQQGSNQNQTHSLHYFLGSEYAAFLYSPISMLASNLTQNLLTSRTNT